MLRLVVYDKPYSKIRHIFPSMEMRNDAFVFFCILNVSLTILLMNNKTLDVFRWVATRSSFAWEETFLISSHCRGCLW